jgi:hypothetical protein
MLLVDVDIVVTRSLKPLLTLAGEGKTVAFAELEGAIDRQIKYYSSGMQMRLGFGVAAFLEPDVLLVDEVLAVGDASFQQRCLDRMRDVLGAPIFLINPGREIPLGPVPRRFAAPSACSRCREDGSMSGWVPTRAPRWDPSSSRGSRSATSTSTGRTSTRRPRRLSGSLRSMFRPNGPPTKVLEPCCADCRQDSWS